MKIKIKQIIHISIVVGEVTDQVVQKNALTLKIDSFYTLTFTLSYLREFLNKYLLGHVLVQKIQPSPKALS